VVKWDQRVSQDTTVNGEEILFLLEIELYCQYLSVILLIPKTTATTIITIRTITVMIRLII
jgi:hypothetical protein